MADKGTGFKNIRNSPASKLWRYFTDPDVNSWDEAGGATTALQQPFTPTRSTGTWNGFLDPREHAAAQLLTQSATAAHVVGAPPPLLRAPAVLATPQSIQKAPMDYSNEPLMAAGRKDASGILYDAMPSTQSRVAAGDAERRPYAYQQPAVRNAYTMGAPADDARARVMAAEAVKRFNAAEELYKSNKTPEAEASFREAQADADRWGKWAAMSPVARKQVLMNGERAANAAQGRENFALLRNEMDTPGAAELLAYAAAVNSGGPAVTRQPDGSATVSGRYGSGSASGKVFPLGTRTALSTVTDNLLLDQAAQARVAPGQAANIY